MLIVCCCLINPSPYPHPARGFAFCHAATVNKNVFLMIVWFTRQDNYKSSNPWAYTQCVPLHHLLAWLWKLHITMNNIYIYVYIRGAIGQPTANLPPSTKLNYSTTKNEILVFWVVKHFEVKCIFWHRLPLITLFSLFVLFCVSCVCDHSLYLSVVLMLWLVSVQ